MLLGSLSPLWAEVEIVTSDGRILSGHIDSRSDENLLWVRMERESIILTTSIPWSVVQGVRIDGADAKVAVLRERFRDLATKEPQGFLAEYEIPRVGQVIQAATHVPISGPDYHRNREPLRVTNIQIDAILVNLDRDVEPDGFEVYLSVFDQRGEPVEVRGNVYARLSGQRSELHGSPLQFQELERWNSRVKRVDFVNGVATFPLRFRRVRPEFDFKLWPDALLNVRMGIPGQGNYEATVPVNLRHFNPFRDRLQVYEGSRFLPGELSKNVRTNQGELMHSGRGIRSR